MVRTARILELDFAVTGLLMTLTFPQIFPVLAAKGTSKGFRVPDENFNIQKMVFVEVEVQRAGVLAM